MIKFFRLFNYKRKIKKDLAMMDVDINVLTLFLQRIDIESLQDTIAELRTEDKPKTEAEKVRAELKSQAIVKLNEQMQYYNKTQEQINGFKVMRESKDNYLKFVNKYGLKLFDRTFTDEQVIIPTVTGKNFQVPEVKGKKPKKDEK